MANAKLHARKRIRSGRRRGFTLLELLTAMALGAILLIATAQVFQAGIRSRERLQERAPELAMLRRAFAVITRDMHSATVAPDESGLQFGLSASGAGAGRNVLQLASVVGDPLLAGRAANETVLIQYAVQEDPQTGRPGLWRFETHYPVQDSSQPGQADGSRALPLLPGVTAATYLFYSAEQQTWIESWEGQIGLPTAIRIDLAIQDADGGAPRQESWTFSLPSAPYQNAEASEASAESSASQ